MLCMQEVCSHTQDNIRLFSAVRQIIPSIKDLWIEVWHLMLALVADFAQYLLCSMQSDVSLLVGDGR
jgi:hypothetical protein